MPTENTKARPKPYVMPQFCKACGRCIDACPKDCITLGTEIDPSTGFTPVVLDLEACTGCGLCFTACPEPYGLAPEPNEFETELLDPAKLFGPRRRQPTGAGRHSRRASCRCPPSSRWSSRATTLRRSARSSPAAATSSATRSRPRPRARS